MYVLRTYARYCDAVDIFSNRTSFNKYGAFTVNHLRNFLLSYYKYLCHIIILHCITRNLKEIARLCEICKYFKHAKTLLDFYFAFIYTCSSVFHAILLMLF